jgi:ubiquinone/menaquinone biosynthesis C-methylase UbiE
VRSAEEIRDVNTRYHDVAAAGYDSKWGIDFGDIGRNQVLMKMRKALGSQLDRGFPRALEIGAGTGYFSLNLLRCGVIGAAVCTDISPGMLKTLRANAERLGLEVETVATDAESLPFADASFDLVLGHAILHHIPNLERAFAEFARVLEPGGTLVFAGEPSRLGDRLANVPKRGAAAVAPLWRTLLGAAPANGHVHVHGANGHGPHAPDGHELEPFVDIHAFAPGDLAGHARAAGFQRVRVRGEELLANWFGWTNRVLEASARPEDVPWAWRQYAYRGYLALQQVDQHLLEPRLPPALFYNLILSARKPA